MQLLKNESLANRVLIGLLATLALMLGAWTWSRLNAAPPAPPALADYFGGTCLASKALIDLMVNGPIRQLAHSCD